MKFYRMGNGKAIYVKGIAKYLKNGKIIHTSHNPAVCSIIVDSKGDLANLTKDDYFYQYPDTHLRQVTPRDLHTAFKWFQTLVRHFPVQTKEYIEGRPDTLSKIFLLNQLENKNITTTSYDVNPKPQKEERNYGKICRFTEKVQRGQERIRNVIRGSAKRASIAVGYIEHRKRAISA
jgi:hypothetical protein